MLFKIILWAIIGYIVYSWFQDKFRLKEGEKKTTIHHHYDEGKKEGKRKGKDDDYIDYEELK